MVAWTMEGRRQKTVAACGHFNRIWGSATRPSPCVPRTSLPLVTARHFISILCCSFGPPPPMVAFSTLWQSQNHFKATGRRLTTICYFPALLGDNMIIGIPMHRYPLALRRSPACITYHRIIALSLVAEDATGLCGTVPYSFLAVWESGLYFTWSVWCLLQQSRVRRSS
ncbi:hypothetical protein BV25DRAFT_272915 [Artomyces pyxidatus]|uniref:Uncharacterized protein n=1 Tax=Artomyces pyxidatus TaxID=48021 RepID=A0ACB8T9D9_9AGAM|nr:hypothetical protein BV25DRAFT_272915 [Artomyces pyxidatus]